MIRRYSNTSILALGKQYGTSFVAAGIRSQIEAGNIPYETTTLKGFQRLDTLAGVYYGDGRLWWVIAAASNIGWGMQVPPGTTIRIPNISEISKLVL